MRCHVMAVVLGAAAVSLLPPAASGSPDQVAAGNVDVVPEPPATPPDQETDARAREIFLHGDGLFSEGAYEQALAAFEESYRLSGRPRILFAMANTYERMERFEEALLVLRRYEPDARPEDAAEVRERIRVLEARVAAQRRAEREAQERAAAEARLLAPAAPAPPEPDARPRGGRPLAGWILAGTGAAAVGAGVAFGVVARDARSDAGDACRQATGGATVCLPAAEDAFARDRLFSRLADASLAVGAAALITGVIVLVAGGDGAPAEQPMITIGPGAMEVSIAGRF